MGILARKKEITPNTRLQRKSDLLFNEIDGEVVMLSIENNEYYGMDKVGSRIWELLKQQMSYKDLVAKLMDEYEVSEKQCKEETISFLQKLADKKLVVIK